MVKRTRTPYLIHVAGIYTPDLGQRCIMCAYEIHEGMDGSPWEQEDDEPSEFSEGSLILVKSMPKGDDRLFDVSDWDEVRIGTEFPGARRCKQ